MPVTDKALMMGVKEVLSVVRSTDPRGVGPRRVAVRGVAASSLRVPEGGRGRSTKSEDFKGFCVFFEHQKEKSNSVCLQSSISRNHQNRPNQQKKTMSHLVATWLEGLDLRTEEVVRKWVGGYYGVN